MAAVANPVAMPTLINFPVTMTTTKKNSSGPFISTATKLYCPTHFKCSHCTRDLLEVGFVELGGGALACEFCWADKLAPVCRGCGRRVKYECLKAMGGDWHEECFKCGRCGRKLGGGASFFVEDGVAYCEAGELGVFWLLW